MGLYLKFSIVLFYLPIIAIYFIIKKVFNNKPNTTVLNKLKLVSIKRYCRYIKLILNSKGIFCIIIFSIISNSIVILQNQKYQNLYQDEQNIEGLATVVSNKKEKEYYYLYKIKVSENNKYKNTYLYLKIDKKSTTILKYGDKISFKGEFVKPTSKRNYGGFDYEKYLKTLKIYGTIKAESIEIIEEKRENSIFSLANQITLKIKQKIDLNMEKEEGAILKGILLGDSSEIEEEIQQNFRISNISHILAVSGMHITYLIMGINLVLKSRIGKKKTRISIIIVLIFYMFITGFSASVVRASVMGILLIGAELLHRKNDTWTSIGISLFLILIYNPFLIMNVGLQFSYLGTIGIIIFHKSVLKFLKNIKIKNRKWRYKFGRKIILLIERIKEILAVTISAQLAILPVMLYHFNLFGTYFILTNLLVSVIIGPILILGMITIILSFIIPFATKAFYFILQFLIKSLILISNLSKLPLAKIYIPTPKMWIILVYYLFILILNYAYLLYNSKELNGTQIRLRSLIALAKYKLFQNKKKCYKIIVISIIAILCFKLIPKKLEIHFVDVGQGDSTFITTPYNKTILIDGGGNLSKEFDVGESTLFPYILDRGYTKIDYIFISHFDSDHVEGILTILEELEVEKVVITKQGEDSENYQKFLEIIKEKRIAVNIVKKGDRIKIEKGLYIDILWPDEEMIEVNVLNNNSMVMKLCYKNFSMLFTGDIEEKAEKKILEAYKGKEGKLQSTILKVAHHGSKTSSTEEFLNVVNPKIALIGVGKNNLFNHPSKITIENLEKRGISIYRTDENGEITIKVSKNCINLTKT